MPRTNLPTRLVSVSIVLTATACSLIGSDGRTPRIETAVVATLEAQAAIASTIKSQVELTVSAYAQSATQAALASSPEVPFSIPTVTPRQEELTPTASVVLLTLSANTHCRAGPSIAYELQGMLLAGDTTKAIAKSTVDNYWYVDNPGRPGEYCWLWGEYATVVGDTSVLPAHTPLPSPTPEPAFAIRFDGVILCEDIYAVFKVWNNGPYTFMTAERDIIDLDRTMDLHPAQLDRRPFAPGPADCPPGQSNNLGPDEVAYIYVLLNPHPSGNTARATIKLCTQDYLGGYCFSQRVDFKVP